MAAMFCMTGAMAQGEFKKMPKKHKDPVAKMARELDLTPEQMTKVRELNAKYPELQMRNRPHHPNVKKDSLRPTMRPDVDPQKKMAQHRELRAKYDKELKSILTKKQFKLYKQNREKMREKHEMHMHGKPEFKN